MPVLAVVCLEPDKALVLLDGEFLPPASGAAVLAHLHEHLLLVVKDHLGNSELPILGVEDDSDLGNVRVFWNRVALAELVGPFAFR